MNNATFHIYSVMATGSFPKTSSNRNSTNRKRSIWLLSLRSLRPYLSGILEEKVLGRDKFESWISLKIMTTNEKRKRSQGALVKVSGLIEKLSLFFPSGKLVFFISAVVKQQTVVYIYEKNAAEYSSNCR